MVLPYLRERSLRGSSTVDEFGMETPEETRRGAPPLQAINPDFATLLERVVAPRMDVHPEWERLDGAYGVPGHEIARFSYGDGIYALNGESRMDALAAIRKWLQENPGEDPLMRGKMRKGVGRLVIRPEVGWPKADAVRIESV
ncbi:hypothetical protein VQH23_01335 [Pararoseomonas sp. SCSIO 73927]|uniref:hypothetical protein n=1 Tax=Pararoseomonas sp. SCSIO 73927 TaxID=3114537 RepID=UPI0030CB03F3